MDKETNNSVQVTETVAQQMQSIASDNNSTPKLEVNVEPKAENPSVVEEDDAATWHINHPLPPVSPAGNALSPGKQHRVLSSTFSQTKESLRESLMSRGSVISSRKLKSQFLIELAVRFAMLSNLKILDSSIDSKHLEIGEKLGGGTFGTVCKAKLRGLDVAVKQLNSGTLTPESILALKIEVEILSKLRHPNIVLFIGISLTATFAAMVTEWCERGCLYDMLVSPSERMTTKVFLKLALDVARGMWYLHSSEKLLIIHRDVKSPNILISLGGSAKVADFGLAVMHDRDLSNNTDGQEFHGNAGTLQWMAPEIIRKEAYGQKVDVYSFGILLVELLTRRMPFRDKYRNLEFKDAVLERNERPTIPVWAMSAKGPASESHKLGELIMECTEMNPKKRPDFSHIIDHLESLFFTYTNNEIRAFEDCDLPRWMESLYSGDFDEITHASYELLESLEEVVSGKAVSAAEKQALFLQHANELISSCLCRIGYGKAAKLKEEGAEYDYEQLPVEVVHNMLRTIDHLITLASSSSSIGSGDSSPEMPAAVCPSVKTYQVETLVDLFLDAKDEDNDWFQALVRFLKSDLFVRNAVIRRTFESKLDERTACSTIPPLALNVSSDSSQMSLTVDEIESKDADMAVKDHLTPDEERLMFDRCKRYGLLPKKFVIRSDSLTSINLALLLEEEIKAMERDLIAKKKQLLEILAAQKQNGIVVVDGKVMREDMGSSSGTSINSNNGVMKMERT